MRLVQKWSFFQLFFQAIQARKMSFTIFQNEKTPFQPIKTISSKSRKFDIFLKGVNPWFWTKNGHFFNFFFLGIIGQENVFYDILEREIALLGYKKKKLKIRKIDIFPKRVTYFFWSKNGRFINFFFQAIQARKRSFTIFQNKKNAFLGYKDKKIKKWKN